MKTQQANATDAGSELKKKSAACMIREKIRPKYEKSCSCNHAVNFLTLALYGSLKCDIEIMN